jgi:hypothetical protein
MLLALTLYLPLLVAAGDDRGRSVDGIVRYHGGEIAPQATVQIEDVESKQVISCVSGPDGRFHFKALKMDRDYTLRATKNGHWSEIHHLSKFSAKTKETVSLHLKAEPE